MLKKASAKISKYGLLLVTLFLSSAHTLQAEEVVKKSIGSDKSPLESLVPMLMGLGLILLIIFVLAVILKKFSNLNLSSSQSKVLDCQRLGTKEKLIIVKVQDRHLLLGVTPQSISHLTELDKPLETKQPQMSFEKLMKQFIGGANSNNNKSDSQSVNGVS